MKWMAPLIGAAALLIGCQGTQSASPRSSASTPATAASAVAAKDAPAPRSAATPLDLAPVYFDTDSALLSETALARLRDLATSLRARPEVRIAIAGHCDERGTEDYNLALGDARARAAREYLQRLGVQGERISTISYGEGRPLDGAPNVAAWAKNRRGEFTVVEQVSLH